MKQSKSATITHHIHYPQITFCSVALT